MKKRRVRIDTIIMIVCATIALIMAAIDTLNEIEISKLTQPEVVYEMANKNIDWS